MSETTPVLGLPLTAAGQAQKHVTVNEALFRLDAVVQLSVLERNRDTPPASPAEGARYIVGAAPTGAFSGHAGEIARRDTGAWTFLAPGIGWCAYVEAENALLAFDGATWTGISPVGGVSELQNLEKLGLATTADASNPLAVKVNNALFAAASAPAGTGDLRFKLNKDSAANTVSQLYQTGYSGRAETGLIGDDQFAIKVSADGAIWRQALVIDPASGVVTAPYGIAGAGGGATDIHALVNVGLAASAASGALTVNLTTASGATPTAGSKCVIPFRAASAATGTVLARQIDTGTTVTLSAGSTLGVPAINTAFALWVVAFDDGGTVRLGVINCLSGKTVFPLARSCPLAGASAEGGAGGADSAHVFYAGAALAGKAYCILGRLEWASGLAALGTWTAPTKIEVLHPAMKLPGDVVQLVSTSTSTQASTTSTSYQSSGIAATITPTSAANVVEVSASAAMWTNSHDMYVALFRGATRLNARRGFINATNSILETACSEIDAPGTSAATTYELKFRSSAGVAVYLPVGIESHPVAGMVLKEIVT